MTPSGIPAVAATRSRGWILAVLTMVYLVNFIDRQILPILLPAIKAEFGLSDALLGLLVGPTFAFFYAIMGIPLAMLADRINRRNLIGVSLILFSAMTALCGLAVQFWQLVIARIATGVGEAGTGPASQTIISDLYPPGERARAQAIYATGVNLGVLAAFAGGGLIAEAFGWRSAFLAAGVPGLILALLLFTTVSDPERGASEARVSADPAASFTVVLKHLWQSKAFRYTVLGACTTCFTGYALGGFFPSFLARSHGMATAQIGLTMALIMGVGGGLATFAAGYLADRLSRRDARWNLYIPAIAAFLPLPLAPLCFLSDNIVVVLICAIPPLALTAAFIGPVIATIQRLVPLRARATSVAILILIDNVIGLGLGPQFVGIASDLWQPHFGEDSLRYAMLTAMLGSAISVGGFLMAARHIREDLIARETVIAESNG